MKNENSKKTTGNSWFDGKICKKCNKHINESKDKYCSLITYDSKKIIEEFWFHLNCYKLWFEDNVERRAMEAFNHSMKYAVKNFTPMLKNILVNNG
jgi:hypothetical protein